MEVVWGWIVRYSKVFFVALSGFKKFISVDFWGIGDLVPVWLFLPVPDLDVPFCGLVIKKRNGVPGADLGERVVLHDFGLIEVDFFGELIDLIIHQQLRINTIFLKKP